MVFVERGLDPSGPSDTSEYVRTDHEAGGYQATAHLAALGHHRLGLVLRGGSPTSKPVAAGFRRAAAELGIEIVDQIAVASTGRRPGQADAALRALVDGGGAGSVGTLHAMTAQQTAGPRHRCRGNLGG